jgi:hypothetical protein
VTDSGGWSAIDAKKEYELIGKAGGLLVTAVGCLRDESAMFTVTGVHADDHDDDSVHDDDDDDDDGKEGKKGNDKNPADRKG